MGHLVLPHWDSVGLVEDDVGGLEHRIAHQPVIHRLFGLAHLPYLVLEGGHPSQPTEGCDHAEERVQGHDLGDVGLDEDDALLRVDARRQPVKYHVFDVGLDLFDLFAGL